MRLSKEVKESKQLLKDVSKSISRVVYDFIFKDVKDVLENSTKKEMINASDSTNISIITKEIEKGNVVISKSGIVNIKKSSVKLSRALKELGAKWDKAKRRFNIDIRKQPNLIQAQTIKLDTVKENLKKIETVLVDKERLLAAQAIASLPEEAVDKLIRDLAERVKISIPSELGIEKKVDEGVIKQFQETYIDNVNLAIVNMNTRAVSRMRKTILPKIMEEGYTNDEISKLLQKEFAMTERHADFVARQEAMIVKSKLIKDRALSLGHNAYIWQTAHDSRVRELHRKLNGKKFYFNAPPIIDDYGNRGNPGETYNCYSKDTEVYTQGGFKLIKDVNIGEEILTVNPKTKDLEWAKCCGKVSKYEKSILEFSNKSFLLKCSKDHTFFTYKTIEHGNGRYSVEPKFITGFNKLGIKTNRFYCSSNWKGCKIDYIHIGNQEIPTKDFCLFMGYYLSEGNCDNREDRNAIKISQTKYLDKMFQDLSFFNPRKGKEAIYIFNTDLKNYLKQFGYSYQKYVPEIIKELDAENIRVFLDAYCLGDGSPRKQTYSTYLKKHLTRYNFYWTSSKKMADDFIELILKCGMSATQNKIKCKGKIVNFRNGQYALNHDVYEIRENRKQHRLLSSMTIKEIPYNDMVYDIEVDKNHTLLIKTGDYIHWNSNCRCIARIILSE